MKKVSLLVLLAILASTLLMAATPTTIVRLTIINKSGYDVYMKLEGSSVTQAFYYFSVPSGTRDTPTVKVYTIQSDLYTRTTWQCNGVKSTGTFLVTGMMRLDFTPCGEKVCAWTRDWKGLYRNPCDGTLYPDPRGNLVLSVGHRKAGEPTMEKVTYFKWVQFGGPSWASAYLYTGFWNWGCGTWFYRIRTYRIPYGCAWFYQY
jgi:hypothetical protein